MDLDHGQYLEGGIILVIEGIAKLHALIREAII